MPVAVDGESRGRSMCGFNETPMNYMRHLGLATIVAVTLGGGNGCSKTPVVTDGRLAPSPKKTPLDATAFQPTTDSPPSGRNPLIFEIRDGHREAMKDSIIWNNRNGLVGTVVNAKHLQASITLKYEQAQFVALATAQGQGEYLNYKTPDGCQAGDDIQTTCYVQAVFRDVAGDGSPRLLLAIGDGLTNLMVNVFNYRANAVEGQRWQNSGAYEGQTFGELDGTTLNLPMGSQGQFEAHNLAVNAGALSHDEGMPNDGSTSNLMGIGLDASKDFNVTLICSGTYARASRTQPLFPRSGEALVAVTSQHGATGVGIKLPTLQVSIDSKFEEGIVTQNRSDTTRIDIQRNNRSHGMEHVVLDRVTGKLSFSGQFQSSVHEVTQDVIDMTCKPGSDDAGRMVLAKWQEEAQASMDDVQRYAAGLTGSLLHGGVCDSLSQVLARTANAVQVPENVRMARLDTLLKSAEQAHCLMQ